MPNAMNWFRRNQKMFLAVLGVVCIVGFVLFEPLFRIFTGSSGGTNPVAVRMNFADLHEHELNQMVQSRSLLNNFLEKVAGTAAYNLAQTRQVQLPPEQVYNFILQQMRAAGIYAPEAANEQGVVRMLLITHEARQMGMDVDNDAALQWLQRATLEQVTPDQMRQIIAGLHVSQRRVFDELRNALLVANMQQALMHVNSLQGTPPGLRWDYFQRLNREVRAEVIALPVADFVSEVAEPTDAALRELFEKYKHYYPVPGQPQPGFRIPVKGKFQGFKAPFEQFASAIEVTDDEIAKYYDEHQENFPYTNIDEESETGTEAKPSEVSTSPDQTEDSAPANAPPTESPPTEDAQPDNTTTSEPPSAEEAAPAAAAETTPATPTEPASGEKPAESPEPSPGGGGDDAGSSEPAETPTGDVTTVAPSNAAAVPESAPSELEKPANAAEVPQGTGASTPEDKVEPSSDYQLPDSIGGGEKPQYDPLWKVSDKIRQTLVREKVRQKINSVFDELSSVMDRHAQQVELYEIEKEEYDAKKAGEVPQPPAPLDLKQLAQQYGVESFETDLITPFDANAIEIGQTTIEGRPFTAVAFENTGLLTPRRAEDLSGDQFLFWKTAASKSKVPTFEEAREEVVAAWKEIEARKLAQERAAKMAAAANSSGESLQTMFGADSKYPVRETGFFSWMTEQTLASQFGQPRVQLSVVPEVPNAGQEFMRATFALQPGRAGSALDAPETTAYVIRVIEQRPEMAELLAKFGAARYPEYAAVAQLDARDFTTRWIEDLESEANLTWERPPYVEGQR
jgi:hypothetical protein